jgi:thiol-disulfide isomerase/thioredoxin
MPRARSWFAVAVLCAALLQSAAEGSRAGTVIDVDAVSLAKIIAKHKRPLLVEWYSPTCGHCVKLDPVLDELAAHYEEQLTVVKIDSRSAGSLSQRYAAHRTGRAAQSAAHDILNHPAHVSSACRVRQPPAPSAYARLNPATPGQAGPWMCEAVWVHEAATRRCREPALHTLRVLRPRGKRSTITTTQLGTPTTGHRDLQTFRMMHGPRTPSDRLEHRRKKNGATADVGELLCTPAGSAGS